MKLRSLCFVLATSSVLACAGESKTVYVFSDGGVPGMMPTAAPSTPAGGCADLDLDGYQDKLCNANAMGVPLRGGDCDDRNNLVNPGRQENCANQFDDDCDGVVNDGCMMCRDLDGDGFQDRACNADRRAGADCDDSDRAINPGVGERCGNFKDDDCRGGDIPCLEQCMDPDLDGYGTGSGCYGADCNPNDASVSPAGVELCGDTIDQDCNGSDLACRQNCQDMDRDGFGVGSGCLGPDCNDADPETNAGARDVPGDMIDQDCNGRDLMLGMNCADRDGDGYGVGNDCLGEDCDDADARVNPGRAEVCGNRKDDDCRDGDRGCSGMGQGACTDVDGDGFGMGGCPRGDMDCDDNNQMVFPDAREVCNGTDDNCNGETDECPRRGQLCNGLDVCVAGPGAPCRADAECNLDANVACNLEVGECRILDGFACEDNAFCNPGAECVVVDGCGDGQRSCFQNKGGPCDESCDCTSVWVCHESALVCVECFSDGNCNAGDSCTTGGYCAESLDLAFGDTRDGVMHGIIDCWSRFGDTAEPQACAILALPNPILVGGLERGQLGPGSEDEISLFACNTDELTSAGYSDGDVAILTEVFGCGAFDLENFYWPDPIRAGSTGESCIYYAPNKSGFGFPQDTRAAIIVDRCDLSLLR
ncbi:MAG: hypothetical protein EXR76_12360 [Myxococcales bacterium]|nr:hypothetical protein [Myxococcales bacterium]